MRCIAGGSFVENKIDWFRGDTLNRVQIITERKAAHTPNQLPFYPNDTLELQTYTVERETFTGAVQKVPLRSC